nr:NapC/NirT family cytochrome c [Rhodoplanes tepidamans]
MLDRRTWILGGVAAAGVVVGIVGWGGFHTAMEMTNTLDFCVSCHEMKSTVYEEYKKSVHFKNASGVRAVCSDCHVPRAWGPKVVAKVMATNDLLEHLKGSLDTTEKFESERLRLARSVWAKMKASDSRECRNCHGFDAMDFHKQKPAAATQMQKAAQTGGTCIDCHKGIAHKLPDMTAGWKTMFASLKAAAATASPKAGETVYTLETVPFTIDKPDGDAGAPAGRILGGTAVTVLARDGDAARVRVSGWQQQGVERMLYARQGKRIFSVLMTPAVTDKVEHAQSMVDPDTGQTWTEGTIDVWIPAKGLVADGRKLWEYGEDLYVSTCTVCHSSPEVAHYSANEWIGVLNSMKQQISLDDEQYRFLQKYLQLHAKDTGGTTH